MKQFQIFRYLKKWRYLIALGMIIGGIGFYFYSTENQSYTASVKIRYINPNAEQGQQPDGSTLDVSEIFSSRVITAVLSDLNINSNIEGIRSRCKVTEIIPEDETLLKAALLDQGKEYVYYPTEYTLQYTAGASSSAEGARRVLSSVLDNYFKSYADDYIAESVMPDNAANLSGASYDYIEQIELLDQSVSDINSLLSRKSEQYSGFRSSKTGYGFSDLYAIYSFIDENVIPYLYAQALDHALTKDSLVLSAKYAQSIADHNRAYQNTTEQLAYIDKVIATYSYKLAENSDAFESLSDSGVTNRGVLQSVYEREGAADTSITYDLLMNQRIAYQLKLCALEISRDRDEDMLRVLGSAQNTQSAHLAARIDSVVKELKSLHQILDATYTEFNEYLVAQNIRVMSNINVSAGLNIKLYMALTVAVFFVCGCVGAVVLGRGEDIMEYIVYNDPRTGLPNRARCDREISAYARGVLPDRFSCVLVTLDNLNLTNDKAGYAVGSTLLRQLSLMLKETAHGLGFVGYNGAGQYLCLFENCTGERADAMRRQLKELVVAYNANNAESQMKVSTVSVCSTDEKVFDIRALVRLAFQRLRDRNVAKK